MEMLSRNVKVVFDKIVGVVFSIILAFIMLGIAIGAIQLFFSGSSTFRVELGKKAMPAYPEFQA